MFHKPSFVEEEEGTVLVFSVLDCRCCATCWERDLERVCTWWFWEISPTLILVPAFIQKKNNGGNKQGLYPFWTPGSLNFIESKNEECFILLLFLFFLRLSRLSCSSALFMVASSTMGVHPAAISGDIVPSFTTTYGFIFVRAARLVHKYNNEPCIKILW